MKCCSSACGDRRPKSNEIQQPLRFQRERLFQPVDNRLMKQPHCPHMAMRPSAILRTHQNMLVRALQFGRELLCLSLEDCIVLTFEDESRSPVTFLQWESPS
jgi:hypothetical protein